MKFKIAFSTCPNDTFIFYALVNGKIKECSYKFETYLADIEELNNLAFSKSFDIIKISFTTLGYLSKNYFLLDSGSALGENCGPLLVSKNYTSLNDLQYKTIGIPGKNTTANFLFDFAVNFKTHKIFLKFDEIMPSIDKNKIDAGVIIHEGRFTYENFNLFKVLDLGEYWEKETGFPIPLGCIVARRDIPIEHIKNINIFLKQSIEYAKDNFYETLPYIKKYAQEMEDNVIKSHIELYVNNYTYSLGKRGSEAVKYFINTGFEKKIFPTNEIEIIKSL